MSRVRGSQVMGAFGALAPLSLLAASALALELGAPAPELDLHDLSGQQVTIASLRGKVVLIDFWASWCQPCAEEMPVLERLYQRYRGDGFTVVGVSVDRDLANVRGFLQRNPVTFPILHDASQRVVGRYGAPRMPTSYFIDRSGVVRHRQDGFHASEAPRMEQRIRALLHER